MAEGEGTLDLKKAPDKRKLNESGMKLLEEDLHGRPPPDVQTSLFATQNQQLSFLLPVDT
jgi:hypothetical protein